ncbi:DnaJ domain-containing protein [Marine Group I thaumarchaeote]|uniref:DnaJ domain-containing protein n=1 Tax=Marine Group I thaumarchaeote TaxID=2511932 RepID=A0A7K4NZM5_9ARCH|nr:DnaJ domain-containing protein [Marine Group I thaumarchaeote]NWJ56473.1 DnaJ domain-containing protein [Marine Group I thaumarchaeote]NWK08499.1 DnaJ domain-containing protein [Marine Group I thaumarchaeote]
MVESNYDILGIVEGSTKKETRNAFRRLALQFHSDRGGENEQFIKIKQAYEDLKIGKKYPDTYIEKIRNSRVFSGDTEAEVRRKNQILGQQLSKEMKTAEEWAAALNRSNLTATRLFGSKTLGEIELERKANGVLSIKGNFMAGNLTYDGSIIMQGSITSPSWTQEYRTNIHLTKGNFKFVNPLETKYKIENGARIIADNGDIIIGNVFGRKYRVEDPEGRVGIFKIQEYKTYISAPNGKIIAENAVNTVLLDANTIIILNVEDDVTLSAREILFYGGKFTHDSVIELKQGGSIRFFENFSIQGLSGDAIIKLENGKKIQLFDLKTKKIKDLADEFVPNKEIYEKNATMVGYGFTITYEMLDNLSKKSNKKQKSGWTSKFRKPKKYSGQSKSGTVKI